MNNTNTDVIICMISLETPRFSVCAPQVGSKHQPGLGFLSMNDKE